MLITKMYTSGEVKVEKQIYYLKAPIYRWSWEHNTSVKIGHAVRHASTPEYVPFEANSFHTRHEGFLKLTESLNKHVL